MDPSWLSAEPLASGALAWSRTRLSSRNRPPDDFDSVVGSSPVEFDVEVEVEDDSLARMRREIESLEERRRLVSSRLESLDSLASLAAEEDARARRLLDELSASRDATRARRDELVSLVSDGAKARESLARAVRETPSLVDVDFEHEPFELAEADAPTVPAVASAPSVSALASARRRVVEAIVGLVSAKAAVSAARRRLGDVDPEVGSEEPEDPREAARAYADRNARDAIVGTLERNRAEAGRLAKKAETISSDYRSRELCGELLLRSLEKRNEATERIVELYFDFAESCARDSEAVDSNEKIVRNCESSRHNQDEPTFFIENLLKLNGDSTVPEAVSSIGSELERVRKILQDVSDERCEAKLSYCKKINTGSKPIEDFIWDGPSDQPNVFNKEAERSLHEMEKFNSENERKVQSIADKYMQLRDSYSCDLTDLTLTKVNF